MTSRVSSINTLLIRSAYPAWMIFFLINQLGLSQNDSYILPYKCFFFFLLIWAFFNITLLIILCFQLRRHHLDSLHHWYVYIFPFLTLIQAFVKTVYISQKLDRATFFFPFFEFDDLNGNELIMTVQFPFVTSYSFQRSFSLLNYSRSI